MYYKVENNKVEVHVTAKDVDSNCTEENIYSYMPKEVQDFINENKNKSTFKKTEILGRVAPYPTNPSEIVDAIAFYFEY
jgi:hypothetical protein